MLTNESRLLASWKHAANDLGIEVSGPYDVVLPTGARFQVPVLVRNFGGSKGMLVLSDYAIVKDWSDEVVQAGYGYSIMSEPEAGEEYARDVFIEVLADWGWRGPMSGKPVWLR
jgi:hypothetical protein